MTLQITKINSASYNVDNRIIFNVDCGDILSVETHIFHTVRDRANDALLTTWLETNTPNAYVEPVEAEPDPIPEEEKISNLRGDRRVKFETTLDKMNPIWYNSLTTTQQDNLATWRQAWLDYPATEIVPDDDLITGIFN